jgi:hypothetical protein
MILSVHRVSRSVKVRGDFTGSRFKKEMQSQMVNTAIFLFDTDSSMTVFARTFSVYFPNLIW